MLFPRVNRRITVEVNNLMNQLPCPALITDATGRILISNTYLHQLVGETVEFWYQKSLDDLCPPASRIFLQTHLWPILYRHASLQEIHLQLYDSRRQSVPVLVNCQKSTYNGQEGYFWVFFVAHERSRFESELLKARREAQQMAEDLAQANIQLSMLHEQLSLYVKAIETENTQLTVLSQIDPLTGLGNRRALENSVASCQQDADCIQGASLLMIDVDHFKVINDEHGHDEGDRILVELAHQLQRSIHEKDLAVRYGGEEFVIWLPSVGRADAETVAHNLHNNVRQITVRSRLIG